MWCKYENIKKKNKPGRKAIWPKSSYKYVNQRHGKTDADTRLILSWLNTLITPAALERAISRQFSNPKYARSILKALRRDRYIINWGDYSLKYGLLLGLRRRYMM